MVWRKTTAVATAILAIAALAACGRNDGPEQTADGLVKVVLAHSSAPSISYAQFDCVPRAAGFFADEGLEVSVEFLDGGSSSVAALRAGQADFMDGVPATLMAANGPATSTREQQVLSFYNLVTKNHVYPAVPADSDIQTMTDLEGKQIGVGSLGSGAIPLIKAFVAADGGDPDKLNFVPVQPGAPMIAALENKQIDALGFFDSTYATLQLQGVALREIHNETDRNSGFSVMYAATRQWIEANKETALGIARAAAKSYVFAIANPEAAVQTCWELYPELKPTGVDETKALSDAVIALNARLANSGPVDGKLGFATDEQIENSIAVQTSAGVAPEGLTIADVWYPDFIDEANDFDHAEIEEYARSYGTD